MAHKYKNVARKLQKHWNVTYMQALNACIEMSENPNFPAFLRAKKQEGKTFQESLFELCDETWEFTDEEEE